MGDGGGNDDGSGERGSNGDGRGGGGGGGCAVASAHIVYVQFVVDGKFCILIRLVIILTYKQPSPCYSFRCICSGH